MSVAVYTSYGQQLDDSGNPLNGGSVTVEEAGTTNLITLKSASDLTGSAAANPIVLDAAGRHDMRYFVLQAYKVIVKNSVGVTISTRDNIDPGVAIGTGVLAITNGGTGAASAAAALSALGAATAAELAAVSAQVAAVTGALGSVEKTHIATGTTAQRPSSPVDGDIRKNTTTARYEGVNAALAYENFVTTTTLLVDARAVLPATTTQYLTSGSSATYTTPSGPAPRTLRIQMVGGGGGGGGATANNGTAGNTTSFNSIAAAGGSAGPGNSSVGAAGGTGGAGSHSLAIAGGDGQGGNGGNGACAGGNSFFGGGGKGQTGAAGGAGKTNSGGGGGGGSSGANGGSGGGAGEYVEFSITSPTTSYLYTVGVAAAGGAAGGQAGGAGGSGLIIVTEFY